MYPQPTNVQGKALKDRTDCSMQIVLSQQKCPLPSLQLISEELAQWFNGRKVSS